MGLVEIRGFGERVVVLVVIWGVGERVGVVVVERLCLTLYIIHR